MSRKCPPYTLLKIRYYQAMNLISDQYNCNQNKYYFSILLIDLQLPMQSAPITTKVVSSNPKIFDFPLTPSCRLLRVKGVLVLWPILAHT
jgi:hypothetical protein